MNEVLRFYKELRPIKGISDRLQNVTDGDMFVAYNVLSGDYEIHSVNTFKQNGISINTDIDADKMNQELIEIIKSCNIKRFGTEIKEQRAYLEKILDSREQDQFNNLMLKGKKMIQASLGREM